MSTTKPRFHITCNKEIAEQISDIASEQQTSASAVITTIVENYLEDREDFYLAKLAKKRHKSTLDKKSLIPHASAWK